MVKLVFICFAAFILAACNDGSSPETASTINLKIITLVKNGKSAEGLKLGEAFLLDHQDSEGVLHATLAHIYTELGDVDNSLRHLQKINSLTINASTEATTAAQSIVQTQSILTIEETKEIRSRATATIGANRIDVHAGDANASVGR